MSDFVKTSDGSVINTNKDEFEKYKMSRERAVREKHLSQRIEKLEQEMKQMKQMFHELSNKME